MTNIYDLALRWCVKPQFLEDIYFILMNDPRFYSGHSPYGVRYADMSRHLRVVYKVEISAPQLQYMVRKLQEQRKKGKNC